MTSVKEALAKLDAVGEPDDIAQYLRSRGIHGHKTDPSSCPIAVYVKQETGVSVRVFPVTGIRWDGGSTDTPWNVRRFVCKFDRNHYPFLKTPAWWGRDEA